MNDASCKIAKVARCRIARHVIGSADVMFSGDGEIYSVDMDDIREVLDTDIIDEYDVEPGEDLIKDTNDAITTALKAVEEYGLDHIELLIDKENDHLYVNYHSKHNSFSIYSFNGYDVQDDFITSYIKGCFEQAGIDVCEY